MINRDKKRLKCWSRWRKIWRILYHVHGKRTCFRWSFGNVGNLFLLICIISLIANFSNTLAFDSKYISEKRSIAINIFLFRQRAQKRPNYFGRFGRAYHLLKSLMVIINWKHAITSGKNLFYFRLCLQTWFFTAYG